MHEAWSWRKVKRKTDRDDALKLARMAALGELPTVPMPAKAAREYRALVQYRDRLVGRRTAAQNRIRALCQRHGVLLPAGPPGLDRGRPGAGRRAGPAASASAARRTSGGASWPWSCASWRR